MSFVLVNFCYYVFLFSSCWERERERDLLKALQPFNKMHLIFLVFALVK